MNLKTSFLLFLFIFFFQSALTAQTISKGELDYAITTAVPFLRIIPDARSSGMADVGVSTNPDNNAFFHNPSKYIFMRSDFGASFNFAPWLSQITNDIFLANANGFYKLNESFAIGLGFRYFTLGKISFKDEFNGDLGTGNPNEFALDASFAYKLSDNLSIGIGGRFIYSDLTNGLTNNNQNRIGLAGAGDIGLFYRSNLGSIGDIQDANINFGVNISNIGTKMSYGSNEPDYLPANLGLGTTFSMAIDDYNEISGTLEFNKLLVPTPKFTVDDIGVRRYIDNNNNGVPDFKESSSFAGLLTSFSDHPDGIGGEIKEVISQLGIEYSYDKSFFVRTGLHYEPIASGGRQFATAGIGVKYNAFLLNVSYVVPLSSVRSPLDNQLKFSLIFNLSEEESRYNSSNSWSSGW
ncbi:MAG: type IX secretion system outer membrane channel protein PorV [Chitinophagales bacterium]|jgi:hypothetical protein|nr:type IX secretion system outer membrane channel protein PorV [Chitinophagales bacterium]